MKKFIVFLIAVCCALVCVPQMTQTTYASTESIHTYYIQDLDTNAKKFYKAFEKMAEENAFAQGKSYDLLKNGVLSNADVRGFQNGDTSLLRSFGAGRDLFYLDHPELFYVDFDKVTLSLKSKGSDFVATIDAGRGDSYLATGFTEATVLSAVTEYNAAISAIKTQLSSATDNYTKVLMANTYLCENVTYSFEADGTELGKEQIRTPYGAIVKKYAVCEGFARAFKAIMDTQDIPCVEVVGYVANDNGGYESHAWNYVQLNSKWYLVDSTLNSSATSQTRYFLLGSENSKEHVESGEISNSGYKVKYPAQATYDYGKEELKTTISYENDTQRITVDYKNYTNIAQMENDALYLAIHHENFDASTNEYEGWLGYYQLSSESQNTMTIDINKNTYSSQIIVTKQAPTSGILYSAIDESKIVAKSDVIRNEKYAPETVAPKVQSITPSPTSVLAVDQEYTVSITYNKAVKIVDNSKPIEINVFSPKSSNLAKHVKYGNAKLSGNTITFSFTPSKMFEHDSLAYNFVPTNIVSSEGNIVPDPATLTFARPWAVCSKIYNDGRLYINSYGSPVLIDGRDLSLTNFLDENGKPVAQNQRSQLVLVAKKPNDKLKESMEGKATELVTSGIIEKSATYEIDLNICGGLTTIPSGSYVKVAFGFPEGYGPEDKGVTFKVFHYKKDSQGNIETTEELDCVVTEYGIVVTVSDFSPFLVAVVKNEVVSTKSIYARNITEGGKFVCSTNDGSHTTAQRPVAKIKSNETVSYSIIPEEGYKVDYAMLGRRKLNVTDNKINLTYAELEANNELKIAYVSTAVAAREEANGETSLNATMLANEIIKTPQQPNTPKNNQGLILALCFTVPVIIALCVPFIIKKRRAAK